MLRRSIASLALLALILPGPAAAAETDTVILRDYTKSVVTYEPCLPGGGGEGLLTVVFDGIFHITDHGDWFSVTETQVGRFTLEPFDPALPDYSGSFRMHVADKVAFPDHILTTTFAATLLGSDGSSIRSQLVMHLLIVDDEVRVERFDVRCR